jgi:hypothetical protein
MKRETLNYLLCLILGYVISQMMSKGSSSCCGGGCTGCKDCKGCSSGGGGGGGGGGSGRGLIEGSYHEMPHHGRH